DVMGKGIPAARVGAATKSQFLRAIGRRTGPFARRRIPSPEEIVGLVHSQVTRQLIDLDSFATACYARFNGLLESAHIVDCGHTRTIQYVRSTGLCAMLKGDNMPLGFSEGEVYRQFSVPFEKGDLFLFYSDGLTEARNINGEPFGEERLSDCLVRYNRFDPDQIVRNIRRDVTVFSASEQLADDMTCIVVKVAGDEVVPVLADELEITSSLGNLARVRAFVREVCRRLPGADVDELVGSELELSLNEAAANVIRHAYHGLEDHPIQIKARYTGGWLIFELNHFGDPFNPNESPPVVFDGSRDSGFGLFIIDQLVDEVAYLTDESRRSSIRLVKRIESGFPE
ncbi:MAG TPA: SpoIIE family protein phosphatase, partial [Blastocatellia bacterium]